MTILEICDLICKVTQTITGILALVHQVYTENKK